MAVDGDAQALGCLKDKAADDPGAAFTLGAVYERTDQVERAEEYFRKALEQGNTTALLALAELHLREGNLEESVAWSYLGTQTFQYGEDPSSPAQLAVGLLDQGFSRIPQDQSEEVERQAMERAREWRNRLAPDENGTEASTCLERIESSAPRYPGRMRNRHQEGWAMVLAKVDANGDVTDTYTVYTGGHPDFATPSEQAVNRWKFDTEECSKESNAMSTSIHYLLEG